MKRGIIPGVVLILIGAYVLLTQLFRLPDGVGMVCIGTFFLVLRTQQRRSYGFTIAGCLAAAVGISDLIESTGMMAQPGLGVFESSITLFMLAIAFFAIHIIERQRIGNWPIIPGIALLCVGGVALLARYPWFSLRLSSLAWTLWPLGLICAGAVMLFGGRRNGAQGEGGRYDAPPPPSPFEPQTGEPKDQAKDTPPDGPVPPAPE